MRCIDHKTRMLCARATVPGIGVTYEEPLYPEVTVDSDKLNPSQCAQRILEVLTKTFA